MTKVEEGILINSQHLYNVLNGISEEVSFKDKILALGYKDIKTFFEDKAVYEMQNILKDKVYTVKMKDFISTLQNLIQNQEYGIISIYTDETCVCHGDNQEKQLNEEYCAAHNIPIYPYNSFGGNIVAAEGDYGIVFLVPRSIDLTEDFLINKVAYLLAKYFDNLEVRGNDILLDNKKIVGSGSFGNDQIFFMMFYFSMTDKGELIKQICGVPMTDKEPGYIDTEILSIEQLREDLLTWLQGL